MRQMTHTQFRKPRKETRLRQTLTAGGTFKTGEEKKDMDRLMTQKDVAEALGFKNSAVLSSTRYKHPERVPQPDKYIGKAPRWKESTIKNFIEAQGTQA